MKLSTEERQLRAAIAATGRALAAQCRNTMANAMTIPNVLSRPLAATPEEMQIDIEDFQDLLKLIALFQRALFELRQKHPTAAKRLVGRAGKHIDGLDTAVRDMLPGAALLGSNWEAR